MGPGTNYSPGPNPLSRLLGSLEGVKALWTNSRSSSGTKEEKGTRHKGMTRVPKLSPGPRASHSAPGTDHTHYRSVALEQSASVSSPANWASDASPLGQEQGPSPCKLLHAAHMPVS